MKAVTPAILGRDPRVWLAFGLGSGLSPKAPGTVGTLAALPFWLLLHELPLISYAVVVLLAAILGIWLCGVASAKLGVHDHPGIVWDEFVGLWITLFAVPSHWFWVLIGVIMFRIFDIIKPWPINWVDKHVHGGLGIMLDDVMAGVMGLCTTQLLVLLFG
ncbi:phosphatidylglycerophosphatase A family protein [Zooshikella harenae]|uniref:Phosphatidylglycerophosphatase A n=1 Tax=Zooshikella harenae TaxID=2827238 RepID=A0ABS5ZFC2_9GAMM|nr:phosphatidylglycerophosphatase A [Zooshikella harenae]MBU2712685.1 phosphatidylglycerophosphatase A [Zooshikella harenae]